MKNLYKLIGVTAITAVIAAVLGCASMTLVSLDTNTIEGPKQVRQGVDINPGDIKVTGIYKDDSRKAVAVKSENIVFDKHTPGVQTVKIRISKQEASFQTQVMPLNTLTASFSSDAATLYTGDMPDSKWPGLDVRGEWEQMGGGKVDVASCKITGYNQEQAGRQTLTVTFEGKTASFNVTVTPSHPLRGDWVLEWEGPSHGLPTFEFKNDGTYATGNTRDGTSTRGTYTTSPPSASEGKITMTLSQVPGKSYSEKYGCLPFMFYARKDMDLAIRLSESKKEEEQRMTDEQINIVLNGIFSSHTRDYAIKDGKLFFDGKDQGGYVRK